MRVKTLRNSDFESECFRLAQMICDDGFRPNMIVGIKTGGEYVANIVGVSFPDAKIHLISLQRPMTTNKQRIKGLIKILPIWMLDIIRVLESLWSRFHRDESPRSIKLPESVKALPTMNVLIVDDAVDSGVTLNTVVSELKKVSPGIVVKSAVITVTTPQPVIMPDYYLYNDSTLIRFPWSMDMKKNV